MTLRSPPLPALAAGVALLGALAWSGVVRNDFVDLDDKYYISTNRVVTGPFDLPTLAHAFSLTDPEIAPYWQPLTLLSLAADHAVFGLDPVAFHVENVLWHLATALLLLLLLARTTDRPWPAAMAAALFAVHPIAVESVAWAVERRVVLAGFFGILGVLLHVAWVRRGGAWRFAASLAAFALSMMAKPLFVAAPLLLLAVDFWPLRRTDARRALLEKIPLAIVCAAAAAAILHTIDLEPEVPHADLPLRLANVALLPFRYLRDLAWPDALAVYYPFPRYIPGWQVILAVGGLGTITFAVWGARRFAPYLLFGWVWFLVALLPTLGLKQQGLWAASADRHAYVAAIGVLVAVAWSGADLLGAARPAWLRPAAAAALLAPLALVTARDVGFWRSSITLYSRLVDVVGAQDSYPHYLLGMALVDAGRRPEGMHHLQRAIAIDPANFDALCGLGGVYLGVDDRRAVEFLGQALYQHPDSDDARASLAVALNRLGRHADTVALYSGPQPRSPDGILALAQALAATGRVDAAMRLASKLPPDLRAEFQRSLPR
jgi:tetratricopeptide (TPR) repeat protein